MPRTASIAKLLATRSYGAHVIQEGETYDAAFSSAKKWRSRHGGILIPAFDDPMVIAGQGTIALELFEQLPALDSIVVPIGGGGLVAGIALAVKHLRPDVEIVGVQALQEPSMARSLESGRRLTVSPKPTLADGIAVATPGETPFPIIQRFVDTVVTVEENLIEQAIIMFLERKHLVVEGAGAAPLAALLGDKVKPRGDRVVLVVSGGNLDLQLMDRIIQRGTLALGRRMRLRILISDQPGSLQRVTALIADHGANILQVHHERLAPEYPVDVSKVEFDLEIHGHSQAEEIVADLDKSGVQVL
jgi:threonine dehydratase